MTLGRIASFYYLDYRSVLQLSQRLMIANSVSDVLLTLCDAHEFDELPVRHNEDGLNETLAQTLPIKVCVIQFHVPV